MLACAVAASLAMTFGATACSPQASTGSGDAVASSESDSGAASDSGASSTDVAVQPSISMGDISIADQQKALLKAACAKFTEKEFADRGVDSSASRCIATSLSWLNGAFSTGQCEVLFRDSSGECPQQYAQYDSKGEFSFATTGVSANGDMTYQGMASTTLHGDDSEWWTQPVSLEQATNIAFGDLTQQLQSRVYKDRGVDSSKCKINNLFIRYSDIGTVEIGGSLRLCDGNGTEFSLGDKDFHDFSYKIDRIGNIYVSQAIAADDGASQTYKQMWVVQ